MAITPMRKVHVIDKETAAQKVVNGLSKFP
jgi:hypothetical protein